MIAEIMGALIVLGVLMVVLVRYQSGRQTDLSAEHQDMRESTEKLRKELERSGNEIIQRLGTHVNQLESLIRQADEQSELLNRRMAEIQAIRQNIQQQLAEGHVLQQQLLEQQRQCQHTFQQMEALWVRGNLPHPIHATESKSLRSATNPSLEAPPPPESFSQMLHESLGGDAGIPAWSKNAYEPVPDAHQLVSQPTLGEQGVEPDQEEPVGEDALGNALGTPDPINSSIANRARLLLREGYSVETVSKETGMGRGAIELLRQIVQRQTDDQ